MRTPGARYAIAVATQDLTGPTWPAAIVVGGLLFAAASWPGNETAAIGEMRTPGLLLAAAGAAIGIFRVARRKVSHDPPRSDSDDEP